MAFPAMGAFDTTPHGLPCSRGVGRVVPLLPRVGDREKSEEGKHHYYRGM